MPTDNQLRKLMKRERLLRNVVESVKEFVQNYQEERDGSSVAARLKKLDEVFDSFCDVRTDIECILDDDELTETETESETNETAAARAQRIAAQQMKRETENAKILKDFVNQYFTLKQSLEAFMCPVGSSTPVVPVPAPGQPASLNSMRVKLPELKLPTFGGTLMEWVTFRDTFKNLIVDNPQLSDVDRFTYLRTSLTGEALQQIASIDLTADNYSIAWDTLVSRYENKKLLVKSHLDALFAVGPMKKESFESLNHVITEFEKHLQMLKKLGEDPKHWSTLLAHMLASKLDHTTLRLWETEHRSNEVPTYTAMMEFLVTHRTVLRSIAGEAHLLATPGETHPSPRRFSRVTNSYAVQEQSCPFCGEDQHWAYQCDSFKNMEIEERRSAAKNNNLCFNCLSRGHTSKFCTRGSCRVCGQRHHSLLHLNNNQSNSNQSTPQSNKRHYSQNLQSNQTQSTSQANIQALNTPQQSSDQSPSISQPIADPSMQYRTPPATRTPSSQNAVLTAHATKMSRSVILATAIVILEDDFGKSIQVRALLDSGSQLCFISENVSQRLQFKRSREFLSISGIGQATRKCKQSIFARVRSRVTSFVVEETFYVLPQVTLNLPVQRVDTNGLDLPEGIILADPSFAEPSSVDMIIGAGLFYNLLNNEQLKLGDDGPMLQNTVLGWVVCGSLPEFQPPQTANFCGSFVALHPRLIDGVVQVGGRLENASNEQWLSGRMEQVYAHADDDTAPTVGEC